MLVLKVLYLNLIKIYFSLIKVIIFSLLIFQENIFSQAFNLRTDAVGLAPPNFALIPGSGTNGVAVADYDRDGDLDIYFTIPSSYSAGDKRTWNRLFSNKGDDTFQDVTSTAGVAGNNSTSISSYMGYKMGGSWGDFDNDGYPDLFLTNAGSNQLFHNNSNGTFTDITNLAGVSGGSTQLSTSAVWFDYDLDGDLDLYVSNWEDYNNGPRDKRNWMYENIGNAQFTNVSEVSGVADSGKTWTTIAIDVNNDGYLDLYLANDFGPNRLYINNGNKTFQEKTAEYGLEDPYEGMGLAISDCDGNGYFDIYLTNVTEMGFEQQVNPLFLNTGNNFFTKTITAGVELAGWGWGTEFIDFENDGDDDLFVGNGYFSTVFTNRFFKNISDQNGVYFEEIGADYGLADTSEVRGVTVFDYNEDGFLDMLISNFTKKPYLYENPIESGNWLKIKLEGTASNRDAFGTIVEFHANGKSYKKYHHGAQFLGQNILPIHFGLNDIQEIEKIIIKWTNGNIEEINNVHANQTILVKEGFGIVSNVYETSFNKSMLPEEINLNGNYPNPFNSSTNIQFEISMAGEIELKIYNTLGQIVKEISEQYSLGGKKIINLNLDDKTSSGLYFYKLNLNNAASKIGKMLLVK